ncbi:MAG TPA: DUF4915 domain-containing protein, partial [Microthrixaceae bacterium]|nr:DUF4915 domain-containing protein [Microthrixaceae bacterium]
HVRHRLTGHGTGAVIDLDAGVVHELGLRAPHTVRRFRDGFVVLDSGRAELVAFDPQWRELRRVPTPGWGRGAVVTPDERVIYVALSSTRRRYLEGNDTSAGLNQVVAIRTDSWEAGEAVAIPGVEQLWSLRLVERRVGDAMARIALP